MKRLACFLIFNLLFCQCLLAGKKTVVKSTAVLELPKNISWKQLVSNSNYCFAAGFENDNAFLYNYKNKTSTEFKNIKKNKYAFISDSRVYFSRIYYDRLRDPEKNKFLIYDFTGKFDGAMNAPNQGYAISFYAEEKTKKIYCNTIDINEYMEGKTNGIIKGGIYKGSMPVIHFQYHPVPPPGVVTLPVAVVKGKTYLAFDNKYNIDVYSEAGKKLLNFGLTGFQNEPYSEKEISCLSPMKKYNARAGITYPPIILKIEICNDGMIWVTRHPRPGSHKLFVDIFDQSGKFTNTLELLLGDDDSLTDSCVLSDTEYCCLVFSEKANKHMIKKYSINSK